MAKVAVVGKRDESMCFMAAGFSVYDADTEEEVVRQVKSAADDGCAVIYLVGEFTYLAKQLGEEYAESITPAVVPLPSSDDKTGVRILKGYVEKAVGSDIVFRDEQI